MKAFWRDVLLKPRGTERDFEAELEPEQDLPGSRWLLELLQHLHLQQG